MMKRNIATQGLILTIAALGLAAPAQADEVKGVWLQREGNSRIRFASCGGPQMCGTIVWLKDTSGPAQIGQRVFFAMTPDGANTWVGSALNPEDGNTYSGKMTVSGHQLVTKGCAFGGLICKSITWSKFD